MPQNTQPAKPPRRLVVMKPNWSLSGSCSALATSIASGQVSGTLLNPAASIRSRR